MKNLIRYFFRNKAEDDIPEMIIPPKVAIEYDPVLGRYIINNNKDEIMNDIKNKGKLPVKNDKVKSNDIKNKSKYPNVLADSVENRETESDKKHQAELQLITNQVAQVTSAANASTQSNNTLAYSNYEVASEIKDDYFRGPTNNRLIFSQEDLEQEVIRTQGMMQEEFNKYFDQQNNMFSQSKMNYESRVFIYKKESEVLKEKYFKLEEVKLKKDLELRRLQLDMATVTQDNAELIRLINSLIKQPADSHSSVTTEETCNANEISLSIVEKSFEFYKNLLNAKQNEVDQLRLNLKRYEVEIENQENLMVGLEDFLSKSLQTLHESIMEYQQGLEQLGQEVEDRNKSIEHLCVELGFCKKQIEDSNEIISKSVNLEEHKKSISLSEKVIEDLKKEIKSGLSSKTALTKEISVLKQDNEKAEKELQSKAKEFKEVKDKLEKELHDLKNENAKIESISSILKVYKTKISEIEHTNFSLQKSKDNFSFGLQAFSNYLHSNIAIDNSEADARPFDFSILSSELKDYLLNLTEDNVFPQLTALLKKIVTDFELIKQEMRIKADETDFSTKFAECCKKETEVLKLTLRAKEESLKEAFSAIKESDFAKKEFKSMAESLESSLKDMSTNNESLQLNIGVLNNEMQRLMSQFEASQLDKKNYSVHIEELLKDLKVAESKRGDSEQIVQDLESQLRELQEKYEELEASTTSIQEEKDQLEQIVYEKDNELRRLETAILNSDEENGRLQQVILEKEADKKKVEDEFFSLTHKARSLLRSKDLKQEELDRIKDLLLKATLEATEEKHLSERRICDLDSLKRVLRTLLLNSKSKLSELEQYMCPEECQVLGVIYERLEHKGAHEENLIGSLSNILQLTFNLTKRLEFKNESSVLKNYILSTECKKLGIEVSILKQENEQLSSSKASHLNYEKQVKDLITKLHLIENTNSELAANNDELTSQLTQLKAEKNQNEESINHSDKLIAELKSELSEMVKTLEKEVGKSALTVSDLESTIVHLSHENEELKATQDQLILRLNSEKEQLQMMVSEEETKRLNLEVQKSNLHTEMETLQKNLENLSESKTEAESLHKLIKSLTLQNEQLHEKSKVFENEICHNQTKTDEALQEQLKLIEAKELAVAALKEYIEKINEEIDAAYRITQYEDSDDYFIKLRVIRSYIEELKDAVNSLQQQLEEQKKDEETQTLPKPSAEPLSKETIQSSEYYRSLEAKCEKLIELIEFTKNSYEEQLEGLTTKFKNKQSNLKKEIEVLNSKIEGLNSQLSQIGEWYDIVNMTLLNVKNNTNMNSPDFLSEDVYSNKSEILCKAIALLESNDSELEDTFYYFYNDSRSFEGLMKVFMLIISQLSTLNENLISTFNAEFKSRNDNEETLLMKIRQLESNDVSTNDDYSIKRKQEALIENLKLEISELKRDLERESSEEKRGLLQELSNLIGDRDSLKIAYDQSQEKIERNLNEIADLKEKNKPVIQNPKQDAIIQGYAASTQELKKPFVPAPKKQMGGFLSNMLTSVFLTEKDTNELTKK